MDRRQLLLGSAGLGALASLGLPEAEAVAREVEGDASPMPTPQTALLPRLPDGDPTRTRIEHG